MRLSVDSSDPGFFAYCVLRDKAVIRVFLDGADVTRRCVIADDKAGVVTLYVLNKAGDPQPDPDYPERFWIMDLEGDVEIRLESKKMGSGMGDRVAR